MLKKKKKKKKTTFDIDAALAEGALPDSSNENSDQMTTDKENQEPPKGDSETKEVELDGKFNECGVCHTYTEAKHDEKVLSLCLLYIVQQPLLAHVSQRTVFVAGKVAVMIEAFSSCTVLYLSPSLYSIKFFNGIHSIVSLKQSKQHRTISPNNYIPILRKTLHVLD
jgi:hypothetical protein